MEVVCESPSKKLCLNDERNSMASVRTPATILRFAKLSEKAFSPTRGSRLAAGYDLYSAYPCVVPPRGQVLCKTDIQISVPHGTYGRVAPRSGLALKHSIDVGAGVIDEDYRGNVGVILFNHSDKEFKVEAGDRVAQLICEKIELPDLQELDKLGDTERGSAGFGSTGVSSTSEPHASGNGGNTANGSAANGHSSPNQENKVSNGSH